MCAFVYTHALANTNARNLYVHECTNSTARKGTDQRYMGPQSYRTVTQHDCDVTTRVREL
jgi:hypothetical protein